MSKLPLELCADATLISARRQVAVHQENCIDFMGRMVKKYPGGIFDIIISDPPYFLSNGGVSVSGMNMVLVDKGDWDKSQGPKRDHQFNLNWLALCQKLLKPNGTIWVSGTHHNIHSVGYAMQQLGFKLLNDIIWVKPSSAPHLFKKCFAHATETLIWAGKHVNVKKQAFNYDDMKEENGECVAHQCATKRRKGFWEPSHTKTNQTFCQDSFSKHKARRHSVRPFHGQCYVWHCCGEPRSKVCGL